jgi:serine/threonine protein kinase
MSSSYPTDSPFDPHEPIPGYVTRELIGRGGFGEVWKAEAPGGLAKAIKIVHAGIDSHRAERELRALQRIKDVRHPLILSIERIEIVSGTLVIVTELADSSLRDLFRKSRDKALPGVPRENLLALLRDAADALDYIYDEYSLQHLDIKPENLLVVGNRLKLGDFGLLKNIYERGASLVSGLTPTYAPPELFEGKPTRQSDQYSLAIVYQHMLTGELPFEGATSAQLAREHLAGVPRLTLLPRSERPIIARALSKVPSERFASCAELISSLAAAPPDPPEPQEPVADAPPLPSVAFRTQTVSVDLPTPSHGGDDGTDTAGLSALWPSGDLPKIAPDAVLGAIETSLRPTPRTTDSSTRRSSAIPGAGFAPTLFIGIGATGGLVLRELRRRLSDAFGPLDAVPAFQMLLLDTDGRQINSLIRNKDEWADVDVVALPLRRPEDYKFRESGLNRWLHRRWLYNMPRSLSTEGYRPLGRLALVDHGPRAVVSLRTALAKAASAENVAKAADATGLPFRPGHVRVVLVASISGATGSGILLDLAYAVRGELKKRSCSDEDVLALLLHSAPYAAADRDKAVANAYATLSELGHYSSPGRYYPGERAIEAPSFHGDNRTFGGAYLVNLGSAVDAAAWTAAAAQIAEYLFCTTATPARLVVDAARHSDEGLVRTNPSTVLLRSLDVRRLDCPDGKDVAESIQHACRDVVALWQTGRPSPPAAPASAATPNPVALLAGNEPTVAEQPDQSEVRAGEWLAEEGLNATALQQMARIIAEQVWGGSEREFLRRLFAQHCPADDVRAEGRAPAVQTARQMLDRLLGESPEAPGAKPQPTPWREHIRNCLAAHAADAGQRLVTRLRGLVDDPDAGVEAARSAAEALTRLLKDLRSRLGAERQALQRTLQDRVREIAAEPPPAKSSRFAWFRPRQTTLVRPPLVEELASYAVSRLDAARLAALQPFLDQVEAPISDLTDQLNHLARDLTSLAAEFPVPPGTAESLSGDAGDSRSAARDYALRIGDALRHDREPIARAVARQFNQHVLTGEQKLQRFLGLHGQLQHTLVAPLRRVARQVVLDQVRQSTQQLIEESARDAAAGQVSACARLVDEFIQERGAERIATHERLLVLAPESVDPRQLQEAFASSRFATLVSGRTNGITLCWERGPRPLEDVADEIVQRQELYRQLADKLHAREDVDWGPLASPRAKSREARFDDVVVRSP